MQFHSVDDALCIIKDPLLSQELPIGQISTIYFGIGTLPNVPGFILYKELKCSNYTHLKKTLSI